MIYTKRKDMERYLGMSDNLDTAIRWLATHDVAALPNGRTDVDGDRVFLNVMDADLRPAGDAAFEVHRRYADLQLDLTGGERWGWADSAAPQGAPDAQKDIGFLTGPEQAAGVLGGGRFVLFLPGEPHKPSCLAPGCTHLRKAVVKFEMR